MDQEKHQQAYQKQDGYGSREPLKQITCHGLIDLRFGAISFCRQCALRPVMNYRAASSGVVAPECFNRGSSPKFAWIPAKCMRE
jgi:hypothetical protein